MTYYDAAKIIESDYQTLLLFESRVMSAIEEGNLLELTKLWDGFRLSLRDRHEEYMYYEHHLMIPLLSSARLAALHTSAPKEEIIQIFHSCITKIAAGESMTINSKIIEQGTYDLCNLVMKSKDIQFHTDICIMCENYIDDHISEKIKASDIARHCGVDRSLIFDIFRKNYNVSLTEYIQTNRIRRAKVLLLHSRASISEIAASLGFGSASYFSKIFASYCGCTPKEYKNEHSKNH
jgi:AraC-like DNA-binding protein